MTDLDDALQGKSGYRGVSPEIAVALHRLGLITEEDVRREVAEYEKEWVQVRSDTEWWYDLAEIAWFIYQPWWEKVKWAFVPPVSWKSQWVEEHRGLLT